MGFKVFLRISDNAQQGVINDNHSYHRDAIQYGTTVFWNIKIAEKQILAVIQIGQITQGLDLFMFTKSGDLLLTLIYIHPCLWLSNDVVTHVGAEQVVLIGDFTFLERTQAS